LEKTISVAYPLCDVLLLAILARIAISGTRSASVVLLLCSGASLLAADALYGPSQLNGDRRVGGRLYPANPPYVSVNVSVRQFRAHDFVNHVLAELAEAGLPPHLLTLEITESLLLGDDEQISIGLATLRRAGIKVSIDDFGTGYSSLSYLHRVAVDTLKLGKSFVDTIAASPRQFDLVRGIIQLGATLRLDVVAEGIETTADRALLIEAQCGLGQGYLFARPMPDADAYLQRNSNVREPLALR
jgi:EAL domain-containing protein (putative c-di-GMP-specific phosphodiesterase class I)